jgi:hypothetical protein
LNLEEVIQDIRQALTEQHEVEIYAVALIKAGSIPKTSSGKISRFATREAFLTGSLELLHQWKKDLARKIESMDSGEETPRTASTFSSKTKKAEAIEQWMVQQVSQRLSLGSLQAAMASIRGGRSLHSEAYLGKNSPHPSLAIPTIRPWPASATTTAGPKERKKAKARGRNPLPSSAWPPISRPKIRRLLEDVIGGQDAVTEVCRSLGGRSFTLRAGRKGKMNTRWGGFLAPLRV